MQANPEPTPRRGRLDRQGTRDAIHLTVGLASGFVLAVIVLRGLMPSQEPDLERYQAIRDFVQGSYVREVDPDELLDRALRGMVEGLDPYSRYYDSAQVAALSRETSGHYDGIGVVFAEPVAEARILFALPGSPAAKAGLGVGDRILQVNGTLVADMRRGDLRRTITADEQALLVVHARSGEERTVTVDLADLVDPTVRHAQVLDDEHGIGYVAITTFTQETPKEFDRELEALKRKGMRALVIDVRGNLGGVLRSAVQIANRFIPRGLVVSHIGRGEPIVHEAVPEEAHYRDTPLVVLVDEDSASASEVFAAALQEHRAAVIVGSPTYGKGMVQQVKSFGTDAVVKLTTSYYYTPSNRNLERTVDKAWNCGLLPDLAIDLTRAEMQQVREHLASYSPPEEALEELRAWERDEQRDLIPSHPPDAQLEAALALFMGERPGAYPAQPSE